MTTGRVTSDALADRAIAPVVLTRPDPPEALSAPEADVWRSIVNARPAGWFTAEMEPILRNLCANVVASQAVEQELREFNTKLLKDRKHLSRYNELSKLHMARSHMVASLSTKLRLTPQARYDRHTTATAAKRAAKETHPWSVERAA